MRYYATADGRTEKAEKIHAVLSDFLGIGAVTDRDILDLGSGSGQIAQWFAGRNRVAAADVVDQMQVAEKDGLRFRKIDPPALPFDDGSFDIVIVNHVLFCMREPVAQFREVRRVLRPGGTCYVASANRYFPQEGFTKLFLLHYLPAPVFRRVARFFGRPEDALFPVGYHRMIRIFSASGFVHREYTGEIIRHPAKFRSDQSAPLGLSVPQCLSPTVVFVLTKPGERV